MADPLIESARLSRAPLWQSADWRPDRAALLTPDGSWSYAELAMTADRWAAALIEAGLRRGDVLGSLMDNGPEAVLAVHAAWRVGATVCPFNTRLSPIELRQQLGLVKPRLLLRHSDRDAMRLSPDGGSAPVSSVLVMGGEEPTVDGEDAGAPLNLLALPLPAGAASWPAADDPAALLFTSGTTGQPKAATLSHGGLQSHAAASALRLGCQHDDIWLSTLPLFHIGGLAILIRSTLAATTMALSRSGKAEDIVRALERWPVTVISLVPTQLHRLLERWPGPPPRSLRALLLGGASVDHDLLSLARLRGWPVAVTYGLTEAGSQVATAWPTTRTDATREIGAPPLPMTQVEIRDRRGRQLPAERVGEIWVRGPGVMTGYWKDPTSSAAALVDGWLRTGDLGWLDVGGRLAVASRREDLIVSGGENVYPAEVESALVSHPDICEACVFGVQDPVWGQAVWAAIVPAAGRGEAEGADEPSHWQRCLDDWLTERLAGYKRPRYYVVAQSLPRTASGKVSRREVREAFGRGSDAV
jgi:O-succinylbenzoic acid--CoA ligase